MSDRGPFGGSLRTETSQSATSSEPTTVRGSQSARPTSLSGRAKRSSSARQKATRHLRGASLITGETVRPELSAQSSATAARTYRRSLSDRLTLSLISAGLVCGISPSLTRKQSGQPILVLALDTPDGGDAARRNAGSLSSNGERPQP